MTLLAGVNYDPASAVNKSTASRLAMTALDTTNLRLVFTAPANGSVLVRIRGTVMGATTFPVVLLGVLQSSTIIARQSGIGGLPGTALATTRVAQEALFTITGLTANTEYTWDAAYGVEVAVTSTGVRYGGPNTNSGADAWGGFQFEIYEAPTLLGSKMYDPTGGAMIDKATTSLLAMTALDTTNLRLVFNAPASGKVLVRMGGSIMGATTAPQILFGVLDGATVRARTTPCGAHKTTATTTTLLTVEGECIVSGLTPDTEYTWDAAYAVQVVLASTGIKYGGPNNTTASDAAGGFLYEIWRV